MPENRVLPLFPLSIILFPTAILPLHIFEPRYLAMIDHCLGLDREFGIALIQEGWEVGAPARPFEIGTIARIVQAQEMLPGHLSIAVVGQQRFKIHALVGGQPYLQAEVELLRDNPTEPVAVSLVDLTSAFLEYVREVRRMARRSDVPLDLPTDPVELSFAIAANLQIPATEQQALLAARLDERLQREDEIIRRELKLLGQIGAVQPPKPLGPSDFSRN